MLTPFWAECARVQRLVALGQAHEDQLADLLKPAEIPNTAFDVRESRRRQLNLGHNLARRDRHRVSLLARSPGTWGPAAPEQPETEAVRREVISEVRRVAGDDWPLLRDTIDGDYAGVAATQGVPVGTLKSRVSRAKAKLAPLLRALA